MTNNPTIDGVSIPRELLSAYISSAEGYDDARLKRELRALLDAPVVERKPDAWIVTDMNGDSYFAYDKQTPSDKALYTVTPEVAALQSTIAQLQARITELESGLGEPEAFMIQRESCFPNMLGHRSLQFSAPDDEPSDNCKITPLYAIAALNGEEK